MPCPDGGACLIRYATGERVRDGTSGLNEWTGYTPREELPIGKSVKDGARESLTSDAAGCDWEGACSDQAHSLTGSGPSGTSMRMRSPSMITG